MNTPSQHKKNIKFQRVKQYFIEACCQIIAAEGVEQATIRKVAEEAGYSYGSIYNYFKDLNEVLWHAREQLMLDMATTIQAEVLKNPELNGNIRAVLKVYMDYLLNNPHIFRFLYVYPLSPVDLPSSQTLESLNMSQGWSSLLQGYVDSGILKPQQVKVVSDLILYAIHGLLMIGMTNNWELKRTMVHNELDQILDYILSKSTGLEIGS